MEGGCTCGAVTYRLTARPMIVHCCHCTWCQRETGSAFVVNALVERDRLDVTGTPDLVMTPFERQGAGDRALPDLPRRAMKPLSERAAQGSVRLRRNAA